MTDGGRTSLEGCGVLLAKKEVIFDPTFLRGEVLRAGTEASGEAFPESFGRLGVLSRGESGSGELVTTNCRLPKKFLMVRFGDMVDVFAAINRFS